MKTFRNQRHLDQTLKIPKYFTNKVFSPHSSRSPHNHSNNRQSHPAYQQSLNKKASNYNSELALHLPKKFHKKNSFVFSFFFFRIKQKIAKYKNEKKTPQFYFIFFLYKKDIEYVYMFCIFMEKNCIVYRECPPFCIWKKKFLWFFNLYVFFIFDFLNCKCWCLFLGKENWDEKRKKKIRLFGKFLLLRTIRKKWISCVEIQLLMLLLLMGVCINDVCSWWNDDGEGEGKVRGSWWKFQLENFSRTWNFVHFPFFSWFFCLHFQISRFPFWIVTVGEAWANINNQIQNTHKFIQKSFL